MPEGISQGAAIFAGKSITTIEGLGSNDRPHPVQAAWVRLQVPQCGYCQSGMIMAVAALLARNPRPTDQQIDEEITNICRCGTYERVRRAIHEISGESPAQRAEGASGG